MRAQTRRSAHFRGNKTPSRAFSGAVRKRLFRQRRPELGSIPVPDAEVQAFYEGQLTASATLPGGDPGRRARRWSGPRAWGSGPDPSRFVIGRGPEARIEVPADLLDGQAQVCLLDNAGPRPRLRLVPGMDGEVRVGVARFGAQQIMGDPSLRDARGAAEYDLPFGAEARIQVGPWTFLIRRASVSGLSAA